MRPNGNGDCREYDLAGDVMLSQEEVPQANQSVLEISMNTVIQQLAAI